MESHINKAIDNNLENKKIKNEEMKQKRKEKMKKKKKNLKLDKQIMHILNPDKFGHESWTEKRKKNIGNLPSPVRGLFIGGCGTGKSTVIKNLIVHADPPYDEVILIHLDAGITAEYSDLDCTDELNEIPDLDYWNYDGKHKKRAVILDDMEFSSAHKERLKNIAILFRYCSTHKGLSIFLAHQSWFDLPPLVKKMSNFFCLWKPRSKVELSQIENRVGLSKGSLKDIFKNICPEIRDSVSIDFTENTPCKYRKNIWTPIIYHDSDEEDDKEEEEEEEEEEPE